MGIGDGVRRVGWLVVMTMVPIISMPSCSAPSDPCADQTGSCLTLDLLGHAGRLDALLVSLSGAVDDGPKDAFPVPVSRLPATVGVLVPDVSGTFAVHGVGLTSGSTIAVGDAQVSLGSGTRARLTLQLLARRGSCSDGILDGDETDVDCGGVCAKCQDSRACLRARDCASGVCTDARCVAAPSCSDGIQNGDESDVDCGGSCAKCQDGRPCRDARDCTSSVCTNGQCVVPSCADGIQNGDESDVDCGGGCQNCEAGKRCRSDSDCERSVCTGGTCNYTPFLNTVTPPYGPSTGGVLLTLLGGNFAPGLSVTINGVTADIQYVDVRMIRLTLPAQPDVTGPVTVLVRNPDGQTAGGVLFEYRERSTALSFEPPRSYSAAPGTGPLVVGDFNGDGRADLATPGNADVSVLLGTEGGAFQDAVSAPVGCTVLRSVAAGDFDGDGTSDLAVICYDDVNVLHPRVLLGTGRGTFQVAADLPGVAYDLGVGDFDGDGKLDLVATDAIGATVFLNTGSGALQTDGAHYSARGIVLSLTVGDFNGNKQDDAVIGVNATDSIRFEYDVSVLLSAGRGTFQDAVKYALPPYLDLPVSAAVGDFNRDGKLDFAIGNVANTVSVFLGTGTGTFEAPREVPVNDRVDDLAVGDFNGDGTDDLVVRDFWSGYVLILLGDGLGAFLPPDYFFVGDFPHSLAVGDFNADGKPDLAVTTLSDNSGRGPRGVAVLLNNSN